MYQPPLFAPQCTWRPPELSSLPNWSGARRVCIDVETKDEELLTLGPGVRRGGYICGIGFAIEEGPKTYLPFRHLHGGNLPEKNVLDYIRYQCKNFQGEVVGANFSYDKDYLMEEGVEFPQVKAFRDILLAEPLLDELKMRYSLDSLGYQYLGERKQKTVLREAAAAYGWKPRKGRRDDLATYIHQVPGQYVGEYGEADVDLPLRILRRQEFKIEEEGLWDIWNLESALLPVVVKMRRRGVRFSHDRLDAVDRNALAETKRQLAFVERETGVKIAPDEVMNSDLYGRAIAAAGLPIYKNSKNGYNVDKELLKGYGEHPVAKALLKARKQNKIRTTFVASIREHAIGDRIHPTLNQLRKEKDSGTGDLEGAGFGRLSCVNPNLQQQPKDPEWRSIFIADDGCEWMQADYSQQEPRWAVHYGVLSKDLLTSEQHASAMRAAEKYRNDPKTDNHQMMADMAGIPRDKAKVIFLGLSYGMGGGKLCRSLGLPTRLVTYDKENRCVIPAESERGRYLIHELGGFSWEGAGEEGQALIDKFDGQVGYVRGMAKACQRRVESRGYLTTAGGRRCRFPRDVSGKVEWSHKAFNRLIQGSSADQTKTAMVEIDRAGLPLQLQVHDEVDCSIENRKQAADITEIMLTCMKMEVPSKVDVEIGPSWGEVKLAA